MSKYLISDIHGDNEAFINAIDWMDLKKDDELILNGDLIDRGIDSKGVLDTTMDLIENGYNVTCLKGNHEQMFLESLNDFSTKINWIRNGGREFLLSFNTTDLSEIPSKYIDFVSSFDLYALRSNYIIVHAGINMLSESPFDDIKSMLWLRDWQKVYDKKWLGNRRVIHGHTPMTKTNIIDQFDTNKDVICIDNGSFLKGIDYGSLCVLNLDDFKVHFQK
ncbi:MAG: hypothetical protein GQ574_28815 [Crocinitomix sp.]|nr:hypothetical protein [Crocinitomix sp.]